ncbi:hypothetical protein OsI_22006 [Oryza sativa Indica Group]|uniref:Uncharacterized protein n=1 Tax=Oryza sativa subsp. indica TaxID=39946 RepID=A2YA95_ORYSI|nr:hypothetical protein OsI_22006 [Oryza sativa Indica Group]
MPFFPRSSTYAAYTIPPPPATPGRPDDDNDHYHEDEDKPLLPPIRHCRRQRTWVRRRFVVPTAYLVGHAGVPAAAGEGQKAE